jgi:hypothetical protein
VERGARRWPYGTRRGSSALSAAVRVRVESVLRRGDQSRFHIVTLGQMTCDATVFVEDEVRGTESEDGDEREVFAKTWRQEAPRDFV